jgi:hypothetical protein
LGFVRQQVATNRGRERRRAAASDDRACHRLPGPIPRHPRRHVVLLGLHPRQQLVVRALWRMHRGAGRGIDPALGSESSLGWTGEYHPV